MECNPLLDDVDTDFNTELENFEKHTKQHWFHSSIRLPAGLKKVTESLRCSNGNGLFRQILLEEGTKQKFGCTVRKLVSNYKHGLGHALRTCESKSFFFPTDHGSRIWVSQNLSSKKKWSQCKENNIDFCAFLAASADSCVVSCSRPKWFLGSPHLCKTLLRDSHHCSSCLIIWVLIGIIHPFPLQSNRPGFFLKLPGILYFICKPPKTERQKWQSSRDL